MAKANMPSLQDFSKAQQRIAGIAIQTPMLQSHWLSEETGANVWFKCENLQRTGAYKLRGAYNMISQLSK